MDIREHLKLFLEPRSVAVIGVPRSVGGGDNVFENLLNFYHFSGRVYGVNPNASGILGHRLYPSINEVPEVVDLAVVMTNRATVPTVVRQCVEKGIKALVVSAQGFAESDEEGKRLQAEIVDIARAGGARIVGPNAFGVGNAFNGLNTAFIRVEMHRVPVGSVTQTGLFFHGFPTFMMVGKSVDLGNACDLDFADVLEYFGDDPDIRLIALHIEDIKDARRFMEVARRVATKKPILALKTGKSEQGRKVAQSHTGSLAGRDEIYSALFRQCGIIRVEDTEELIDLAKAFWRLPPMRGKRLGVVTIALSCGVMAADACQRYGLEIAKLSPQTARLLRKASPAWAHPANPMDVVPLAMSGLGYREAFHLLLKTALRDEGIDGVIFMVPVLPAQRETYDFSSQADAAASSFPHKPVVGWLSGLDPDQSSRLKYEQTGRVIIFPSIERAVKALARVWEYNQFLGQHPDRAQGNRRRAQGSK